MKPVVNLYKLGRLPYVKALNVQRVLFDNLKKIVTSSPTVYGDDNVFKLQTFGDGDYKNSELHPRAPNLRSRNSLVLVEHEPVYTIGIRSKEYNDNYVSKLKRKLGEHKLVADFVHTNRGGLITFHGPGQLVAYPIIYLGDFTKAVKNRSVKAYVSLLETTIIDTLDRIGLKGAHTVREYPGVWLGGGERKIAFIGISCKRFVTMHGISINCDCDLSWFDHIVSCGIEDKAITSALQELLLANKQAQDELNLTWREDSCHFGDYTSKHHVIGQVQNPEISCLRSSVEHVSEAFCQSFSQQFDCELIEDPEFSIANGLQHSKIN